MLDLKMSFSGEYHLTQITKSILHVVKIKNELYSTIETTTHGNIKYKMK